MLEKKKLNILYLHTHDTGRLISAYGYDMPTPHYQAFCDDSLLFQNAFSVAPTCSPSRAGLLTGVFPHQNGMLGLAQRGFHINRKMHLAEILRTNGYHTSLCGVQHEIGYYTEHEKAIGTIGYIEDLSADNTHYSETDLVYWDRRNAHKLCKWLGKWQEETPFFVSYGMHATHRRYPENQQPTSKSRPPLNIPNTPETREDYARFQTSASMADENIGMIIKALQENGLYEKTIIILTTDHGIAYPFAKCSLHDEGLGVLLAVRVPGMKCQGKSFEGLISQVDILPTLFDLVGIEKPEYLMGRSFADLFAGKECQGDEAVFGEINYHTSYEPVRSVRTKRYKYIRYFDTEYDQVNYSNIDNSPIKDLLRKNGLSEIRKPAEALYDTYYDRFETNNVIAEPRYATVAGEMRKRLADFMQRTKDPLLQGPIAVQPEWKVNKKECWSPGSKEPDNYESLGGKEE